MRRLASAVLFLFLANLAFAAMGPHCGLGTPNSSERSLASHDAAHHDHGGRHHEAPDTPPDQGDLCASMQLAAVLSGVSTPNGPKVETTFALAAVPKAVVVDPLPVEETGIPPPPLIAAGYDAAYAKTGRLLI